jgi:arginyl-tRNA synthetase
MTFRERLEDLLLAAYKAEFPEAEEIRFDVNPPREKAHGDFATNLAMAAAKVVGEAPMDIARRVAARIAAPAGLVQSIEVKKPGFINIFISREAYLEKLAEIGSFPDDEQYGFADLGKGSMVQVEFVSANPTGPLNVVSARAAAVGDALVRLLKRIGYDARSEFYVNDSGSQVEHLGESLKARFKQELGQDVPVPPEGYPGEYLVPIARKVRQLARWADDATRQWALIPRDMETERVAVADFLARETAGSPGGGEGVVVGLQDYLEFKGGLEEDLRSSWPVAYVCTLSQRGFTYGASAERLIWVERYASFLKAEYPAGGENGKAVIKAEDFFLEGWAGRPGFDFARFAVEEIVAGQKTSLAGFGKRPEGGLVFDKWFRESDLGDEVDATLRALAADGRFVEEKEGALWLRGGEGEGAGEEDEWVIKRKTGQPTYFLSDIAYHVNKRRRGFEHVIDIWGPDHHGHVARMQAAMSVISQVMDDVDIPQGWLEILIAQQVNLIREGQRVVMSKRAGEYVTLDDVAEEVGADVARFFFLMRRCNSHLDFDLDLAKQASDENPVYYVQYAHARISSVLEFARKNGYQEIPPDKANLALLSSDEAMEVVKALCEFEDLVRSSAGALEPHRLTTYLIELAGKYHRFYHNHRVVSDDRPLSEARLYLCYCVRTVIRSALSLLGISAPTSM